MSMKFSAAIFCACLGHAATIYSVVNLGGLGGTTSVAHGISNNGIATGWATTASNANHAFSASSGSLQDLTPAGTGNAYALAINDAGQMVGSSYIGAEAHGLFWSAGGVTDLGLNTYGMDIN